MTDNKSSKHPFRRAVLRGLGVVLPPLLTIVFFLWLWNSVQSYILQPLDSLANAVIYLSIADVYEEAPRGVNPSPSGTYNFGDNRYVKLPTGQLIPSVIHETVMKNPGLDMPSTAKGFYKRYIATQIIPRRWTIPFMFCMLVLVSYLLGKFIAASVGRLIVHNFERIISRLPIISTVYSAVKQVTDLIFSDDEIEYTRVVAIEYPRRGLWSLGFVTGESMLSLQNAAQEPVLSVLMPTSPMPATGFTVTVRRSEAVDLALTVDQAFQFIVSCGVVVPVGEQTEDVQEELQAAVQKQIADNH